MTAIVGVSLACAVLALGLVPSELPFMLPEVIGWLAHLGLVHFLFLDVRPFNFVTWTLPVELAFYGLVAVWLALRGRLRHSGLVCIGLLAAA